MCVCLWSRTNSLISVCINIPRYHCIYLCAPQVGRAGRFGTKGLAITFVASETDSGVLNSVQVRSWDVHKWKDPVMVHLVIKTCCHATGASMNMSPCHTYESDDGCILPCCCRMLLPSFSRTLLALWFSTHHTTARVRRASRDTHRLPYVIFWTQPGL